MEKKAGIASRKKFGEPPRVDIVARERASYSYIESDSVTDINFSRGSFSDMHGIVFTHLLE
jgi:hypothetical protein